MDFSIVSVHLKSGTKNTDLESREASLERIDEALSRFTQADGDLILLGDFNTMGTASVDPKTEIENLEQIAQKELQLRHPDIAPQCTEYFRGNGGWLDHVLITQSMQEAPVVEVRVSGYCALANCDRLERAGQIAEGFPDRNQAVSFALHGFILPCGLDKNHRGIYSTINSYPDQRCDAGRCPVSRNGARGVRCLAEMGAFSGRKESWLTCVDMP